MPDVTDTAEQTPVIVPDEDEMPAFGGWSFFVFGLLLGFVATGGIGMLFLMQNDPLGPEARRPTPSTVAPVAPGDGVLGEAVFASTCATCHGPTGEGIEGLGPALIDNEFLQSMTDAELVAFIEAGRGAADPDNTTGIAMPPKGGNPSLTDQDLVDVVAYLRTLR